jgi:hypothetical protein
VILVHGYFGNRGFFGALLRHSRRGRGARLRAGLSPRPSPPSRISPRPSIGISSASPRRRAKPRVGARVPQHGRPRDAPLPCESRAGTRCEGDHDRKPPRWNRALEPGAGRQRRPDARNTEFNRRDCGARRPPARRCARHLDLFPRRQHGDAAGHELPRLVAQRPRSPAWATSRSCRPRRPSRPS